MEPEAKQPSDKQEQHASVVEPTSQHSEQAQTEAEQALAAWARNPLPQEARPLWKRYGAAAIGTALAILLRVILQPILGDFVPLATLFGAVAFSVWYGGIGPALFSVIAGYIAVEWFIVQPIYAVSFSSAHALGLALFLFSSLIIMGLGEERRRAQHQAHQNAQVAVARQDELRLAKEQAERYSDRISRLQQITAALSEPATPSQLAETILQQGTQASGAVAGILVEVVEAGQSIRTIAALGYPAAAVRTEPVPLAAPTPMSDCIRNRQAVWIRSQQEFADQYPAIAEFRASLGNQATAALPLLVGDRILGGLAFSFVEIQNFEEDEQKFFEAVAQRCAEALERARADEALRISEERLRLATEAAQICAWELDMEKQTYTLGENFAQVLGFSSDLLPDNSADVFQRFTVPEDVQLVQQTVTSAMQSQADVRRLQYRILNPENGKAIWLEVNAKVVYSPEGNPQRMFGMAQNITSSKHQEQLLRDQEAELEQIINQTPFMLTRCSRDLHYQFVSRAYAERIGRTPAEVVGKPIVDIMGEAGLNTIMPYIEQVLQGQRVEYETEVSFEGVGTPALHVVYVPDYDEQGNVIGWFASIVDITERKRTEQLLRSERELLNQLFNTMPVMVSIYDPAANSMRLNAEFERLIGWKSEEVTVLSLLEALYPEPEYRNDVLQRMATVERNEWVEVQVQTRAGRTLDSLWSNISIQHDGQLATGIAIGIDITERKQAEAALRQSEARERERATQLEAMMETVPAVIWIAHDTECTVVTGNRASYEVLRLPFGGNASLSAPEDMRPMNFEVWHADQLLAPGELPVQRAARGDESHNYEEEVRFADGTSVFLFGNAVTLRNAQHNPVGALAAFVDITERKRAEQALQQLNFELESRVERRTTELRSVNEHLLKEIEERSRVEESLRESDETTRLILDTSPDAIVIANQHGHIVRVNAQIKSLFGYEPNEVIGKPIESLIPQRFHERHIQHRSYYREHSHRRPMGLGMELSGQRKNGSEFSVDIMLTPIQNIGDWETMVTIRDSTERKQMENALRDSQRRLQFLSQRLVEVQEEERRAIASELHDSVGQSLSALNLNLTIIYRQFSPFVNDEVKERFSDCMSLVADIIALVRDVMSNLRPTVLDDYGVEAALQMTLEKFKSRSGIGIQFNKSAMDIPRLGSAIEMTLLRITQEGLMNVLRHAQADQVVLSLRVDEQVVRLTLEDNGTGIRSWQAANRPGSHGMTIMRERAEAVGGNLKVSSTADNGTRIEVSIPFRNPTVEESNQ